MDAHMDPNKFVASASEKDKCESFVALERLLRKGTGVTKTIQFYDETCETYEKVSISSSALHLLTLESMYLFIYLLNNYLILLNRTRNPNTSSQCSTTGVTKAVVCAILSVGWCI